MDRLKLEKFVFASAIVLLPASYTMKYFLGVLNITWVDPTLVLGVLLFLSCGFRAKEQWTGLLAIYAFVSALIGGWYLQPSFEKEKSHLYILFQEPIRLALNIVWFWVCIECWRRYRQLALKWLAIAATLQLAVAGYLYLALLDVLPAPDLVQLYLDIYKTRQPIWIGDFLIYRMAGTFFEAPPFGLFMVCCFVVFVLELTKPWTNASESTRTWVKVGAVVSLVGTVASLSEQVLVALVILGAGFLLTKMREASAVAGTALMAAALAAATYAGFQLTMQWSSARTSAEEVYGHSMGERLYHMKYAGTVFLEEPASLITGIGPGRYGDYVSRTGIFESTVVPGVTVTEWIVEYGILGSLLIVGWMHRISNAARSTFGHFGVAAIVALVVANMFQMNWKFESWFLALAYLLARSTPNEESEGLQTTLDNCPIEAVRP